MDIKGGMVGEIIEKGQQATTSATSDVVQTVQRVVNEDNERTKEMVQDFYSPSDDYVQSSPQQQEQVDTDQRLIQVRQQLHQELHNEVYYNPLINPEKPVEESKIDKLEHQKQQELQELQIKEAQKPLPLVVQRAQTSTEINRGVVG